jgi:hypothetical protein
VIRFDIVRILASYFARCGAWTHYEVGIEADLGDDLRKREMDGIVFNVLKVDEKCSVEMVYVNVVRSSDVLK